jgi:hypothetical protein
MSAENPSEPVTVIVADGRSLGRQHRRGGRRPGEGPVRSLSRAAAPGVRVRLSGCRPPDLPGGARER